MISMACLKNVHLSFLIPQDATDPFLRMDQCGATSAVKRRVLTGQNLIVVLSWFPFVKVSMFNFILEFQ